MTEECSLFCKARAYTIVFLLMICTCGELGFDTALLPLALSPLAHAQDYTQDIDLLATAEGRATVFQALVDIFKENYWKTDHIDWDMWADEFRDDAIKANSRRKFDRILRNMVDAVNDEHSSWMGKVVYTETEDIYEDIADARDQRLGLGFEHDYLEDVGVVIQRVYPNTPANSAGLLRGDVIVAVGNKNTTKLSWEGASAIFQKAIKQGNVKLTVKRNSNLQQIIVSPDLIDFAIVKNLPYATMLNTHVGYLYIPTFNILDTAQKVHVLLEELQKDGADALVLDLRDNLGGHLSEMGLVLGAFVEGEWGQAVSRNTIIWQSRYAKDASNNIGRIELVSPTGETISEAWLESPTTFTGKLAVIVSKENSSAGEIAPLVLQNRKRATIIGEATNGNVEAVRGFDLPDGSLVMVAVANISSSDGTPFDQGVQPDVIARSELTELARGYDAPISEALRTLQDLPFTPNKYF